MSIATRYQCSNRDRVSAAHTSGDGKPRTKKCRGCGSSFFVQEGGYGAIAHSAGSGRYNAEDVVRWFTTDKAASAWIDANDTTGTLVVRWFDSRRCDSCDTASVGLRYSPQHGAHFCGGCHLRESLVS